MRAVVLVPSVDEGARLVRSLPVAAAQRGLVAVVVVDDACADGSGEIARAAGARVVRLERRVSYAAAVTAGLASVRAVEAPDAVLLLGADCLLPGPGFLPALLARLEADPGVGSVAPKLVREADPSRIDAAGMTITRARKNGLVGHGDPAWRYSTPGEAFGPDGACALYRAAALDDAGWALDDAMALWATDADLAWRLRRHGWRCAYEPRAVARHERTYSPTTRARIAPAHRRLQFRNRLLMLARNERRADALRDALPIAGYEVLALGHALLRERALLGGYADAARAWRAARRERPRGGTAPIPWGLRPPR